MKKRQVAVYEKDATKLLKLAWKLSIRNNKKLSIADMVSMLLKQTGGRSDGRILCKMQKKKKNNKTKKNNLQKQKKGNTGNLSKVRNKNNKDTLNEIRFKTSVINGVDANDV